MIPVVAHIPVTVAQFQYQLPINHIQTNHY
jgi:hypothetical protein